MSKILIAEDDKFLANAYRLKLSKYNYEVTLAYDGDETIEALKKERPDLMILDLVMPKTDGFAVLETVKKTPEWANIPVIVVTNLGQQEDYERVTKLGALEYVVKTDISLDDLIEKIRKVIS